MSIIPPPLVGSVLQTSTAQQQQSRLQDVESNRRAVAARELAAIDQHQSTEVEDTDADGRVHPDSGGQGSRGREFHEEDHSDEPALEPKADEENKSPARLDVRA